MEKKPQASPKPAPNRRAPRDKQGASPAQQESLMEALKQLPDARAGMVARARRLAADPGYPYEETLRGLAEILATHLEFDGFSY